jgi:hypothetical protein
MFRASRDSRLQLELSVSSNVELSEAKLSLAFTELRIVSCVFYITNEMRRVRRSLLLSALYMFQFQPIHTSGRQQESMEIPKAAHSFISF